MRVNVILDGTRNPVSQTEPKRKLAETMAKEPRDKTCAVRYFIRTLRYAAADEDEEKSQAGLTARSILEASDGRGTQADGGEERESGEAALEGCQAAGISLGEATGASMAAEAGGGGGERHEARATPEAGCQVAGLSQMSLEGRRGSKTSALDDDTDDDEDGEEYVDDDSDSSIETFFPRSESTDDIIAIIREQENEEQEEQEDQDDLLEAPEASSSPGASGEAKGCLGVRRRMAFREPRKANFNFR